MSDLGEVTDAILGHDSGAVQDAAPDNEIQSLADDVARFESWQAERSVAMGLATAEPTSADEFADALQNDPSEGGHKVPLHVLHAERGKRQELEVQVELARQQTVQQAALLQQLEAQMAAAQQAPTLDFDDDPRAYVEHREQQFAQQLGAMQQQLAGQQFERQVEAVQQVASQCEAAVCQQVGQENFTEALAVVAADAARHYRMTVPHASDLECQQQFAREIFNLTHGGGNAAAVIYQQAQRLGFQPRGADLAAMWDEAAAQAGR